MRGWLVVNHFLRTEAFTWLYGRFLESASARGIALEEVTNLEALVKLEAVEELPDFVLFWDKDLRLCERIELCGIPAFNSSGAIGACDDKALTYLTLSRDSALRQPKSIILPKAYTAPDWSKTELADMLVSQLGIPLVLKEAVGSFGEQVRCAETREELDALLSDLGCKPAIAQEFVETSLGRDVRIMVVGGRPIAAMLRRSATGDFRSNIQNGGSAEAFEPSEAFKQAAVAAVAACGLDFGGVDILFGEAGLPLICEVNSNAHFRGLESCTGVDVASAILAHIEASLAPHN